MGNKKVIVTGAHGFIGRRAARFFAAKGWRVIGIGRGNFAEGEMASCGVHEWHDADVTLKNLKKFCPAEADAIIHCAGSGSVGLSLSDPFQDYLCNVDTVVNVLEFARLHAPGAGIVLPSSAAVYGSAEKLPITEDAALAPISPYGAHKKIAEELCRSYSAHFGVKTAIIRFFSVYGPDLRRLLLWDTCKKITAGDTRFWGDGTEMRDWIYVEDAARLIYAASERADAGAPVVNGGSGKGITVRDAVEEVFRRFDRKDAPIFSGDKRLGDPAHYVADISRAKAWGWAPETGFREGVRDYVEWFRKCGS